MATARLSSQSMVLPRREPYAAPRLDHPGIVAWLPLASILVGIVSLFYLAQTSELTTTGYNIQELQTEEKNWKLRNEQLALELARARSLAAVEREAIGRMLMVQPKQVLYLRTSPVTGTLRASPSSRGEDHRLPALEKAEPQVSDPLGPVRDSLVSLLTPRPQPARR